MEYLSKITLKTIGVQPQPHKVAADELLCTVYGIAQRYKLGTSNYGEFTRFIGDFEAVRASDGEGFRSSSLLLPQTFADTLRTALDRAGEDAKSGIQFGVSIGVKPSDVPCGYVYTIHPVLKSDASDPLAPLRDDITKALPAPARAKRK